MIISHILITLTLNPLKNKKNTFFEIYINNNFYIEIKIKVNL